MVELFHIVRVAPELLERERRRTLALLRALVPFAEVAEIGSTAVGGVLGKDDLDILVRVPRPLFAETRAQLDAQFERNPHQFADDEFQGYHVASPLDVCVQLTVSQGRHDDFETFRDLLRADPALRAAYNDLKRAWDGRPMADYRQAKSEFITASLKRASKRQS